MEKQELIQALDAIRGLMEDKKGEEAGKALRSLVDETTATTAKRIDAIYDVGATAGISVAIKAIDAFIIDLEAQTITKCEECGEDLPPTEQEANWCQACCDKDREAE